MSPRPKKDNIEKLQDNKEALDALLAVDPEQVDSVSVVESPKSPTKVSYKPFMEYETPVPDHKDQSVIINPNLKYHYRWIRKEKMAGNIYEGTDFRYKGYRVVDKRHPDFKGMYTLVDVTPSASFFSRADDVLCCIHEDTFKQRVAMKTANIANRAKMFEKNKQSVMDKVYHEMKKNDFRQADKTLDSGLGEIESMKNNN